MSELTFGADPEFVFKQKGYFVPARNFINDGNHRMHVGVDGHADTGEIRPIPQKSGLELAKEIEKRLKECYIRVATPHKLTMHAGSMGGDGNPEPLGGHIHFGGIKAQGQINDLAQYCDAIQVMLLFLEDYNENALRRKRGYGKLGDQRVKDHGFEYRVPGSWLVNPTICKGTLCLFHSLAHDFIKKKLTIQHPLTKVKNWLMNYDVITEFTNANHDVFRYKLKPVMSGIQELSLYKTNYNNYANYINSLFSLIKNGKQWDEDTDVFVNWGFDRDLQEAILFNIRAGYRMEEINVRNVNITAQKALEKFPIQIFALGRKDNYNLCTNDDKLLAIINRFKEEFYAEEIKITKMSKLDTSKLQLGIGRELRERHIDLIIDLIKFIKNNKKQLV